MGEKHVQNQILLQYGARKGLRIWRVNTGKAYGYSIVKRVLAEIGELEKLGRMPLTSYGTPGTPDIHGILDGGRYLAIEVKGLGGKMSPEQIAWRKMFEARGGLFVEARDPEEVGIALHRAGVVG